MDNNTRKLVKQLKPIEVVRNECGTWIHPEFQQYIKDHFNNAEWVSQEQWDEMQRYFNIQTTKIYMEGNVPSDDWERMMDSCDISKWEPITPHGFFLIDIYFGEDDAEAIFAREIRSESEVPASNMIEQLQDMEKLRQEMKLQAMQVAFEKAQAVKHSCDYEQLKANLDKQEAEVGNRYLVGFSNDWAVWQEAWQTAQEQMLQTRYNKLSSHDYVLIPAEMSDEIAEAIAHNANCCGGIAYDIYQAIIKTQESKT